MKKITTIILTILFNISVVLAQESAVSKTGESITLIFWGTIIETLAPYLVFIVVIILMKKDILIIKIRLYYIKWCTGKHVFLFSDIIHLLTITKLEKYLNKYQGKDIILIFNTLGGDIFAITRGVKAIEHHQGKITAMIPKYAMSGGTILSLACDDMMMPQSASLGPVDPQLGHLFWVYSSKAWKQVMKIKGKKAEDKSIMMGLYAEQYTKSIRMMIEGLGITNKDTLDKLTSGEVEHSFQFSGEQFNEMGIPVKTFDHSSLQKIIENNPQYVGGV